MSKREGTVESVQSVEYLGREHLVAITSGYNPVDLHAHGELKILPISEVMERYSCGYAGGTSWNQWFEEAREDTRVKDLMEELTGSGEEFFQEPILLGYYPEEIDEDGELEPEDHLVFNGMHRFAAYHFLGREWGYFSLGRNPEQEESLIIEVTMEVNKTRENMAEEEWDDALDKLWDLSSWRVGGDVAKPWVSIECAFSGPGSVELVLASPATEAELRSSLPQLLQDVTNRFDFLAPEKVNVQLKRYQTMTEDSERSEEVLLMELSSGE